MMGVGDSFGGKGGVETVKFVGPGNETVGEREKRKQGIRLCDKRRMTIRAPSKRED